MDTTNATRIKLLKLVCYDNSFLHFAIFFPSLADSKRAFLALPCRESIRRLSASASWESHPRALARTLSCKYHHSSRLSSPPSGAVPQRSDSRPTARRSLGNGSAVPDQLVFDCQRSVLRNRLRKNTIAGRDTLQRLSDMVKTAF